MRGALLILAVVVVCVIPGAQNAYNDDYNRDEENLPSYLDEKVDNEDYPVLPSTILPDADVFDNEEEKEVSEAENSFYQTDNTSVTSLPYTEEEEIGATQDTKIRRTQPRINPDTCGPPPTIERTMIVSGKSSTYGLGSVVTYSCKFGYVSDGSRQAKCIRSEDSDDLEWTEPNIRCTPQSCGDPGYVENGKRIGSLFTFPNRVTFECEEGYEVKGSSTRYCQPSGTWSGKLPKCEKLSCKPPPDIENGKVSYTSLEYGSELRYTCDPGFILKKHTTRYCAENKTWSGEDPLCKDAQCDVPVTPKDGSFQIVGDKPVVNARVIFSCNADKVLSGNKVSICMENGDWTFPPPKCVDPCSIPNVPHGKITKKDKSSWRYYKVPVGNKVETYEDLYLECDKNYEPLGKSYERVKIKCSNGIWTDEPRCEPGSCLGKIPPTPNGDITKHSRKHGGTVVYSCWRNFKKTQYGNVTCNAGTWIGNTPVCIDPRCYIDAVQFNGMIKPRKTVYNSRETFKPECENRYIKKSDNRFTCIDGKWNVTFAPCVPASCKNQPPPIDHGRYKPYSEDHSSIVAYECEEGFFLQEHEFSKVECLFGEWKGTPPKCQDSRCYHRNLLKTYGLEKDDDFTRNREYMKVKCTVGFTFVENSEPFCSEGVWKQPNSPCRENGCTSLKILNGGFHREKIIKHFMRRNEVTFPKVALNTFYNPGDKLFVICEGDFKFQGKRENKAQVTCSKGQWVPEPVCLTYGTPFTSERKQHISPDISSRPEIVTPKARIAPELSPVPTSTPAETCSCTYWNSDPKIIGFSGLERLTDGTKVKKGCRIKFQCLHYGYQFFNGASELVCDSCRDWEQSEYPQCVNPFETDVIFRFSHSPKMIGNEINLNEGEYLDIYCFSYYHTNMQWLSAPETKGISIFASTIQVDQYSVRAVTLRIDPDSAPSRGVYSCNIPGYRPRSVRIKVTANECPYIEETEDLSVHYENGQKINNQVLFSCKKENARLVGHQVLTCQSNRQWSGEIPRCDIPVQCPELEESGGVTIHYPNDRFVGSRATFHCFAPTKRIGDSFAICEWNGVWSKPVPVCLLQNCSMDALFRSFPEGVTTDIEEGNRDTMPYNSTVGLRCKENLLLRERRVATCKEDGIWDVPDVQCISGCAPLLPTDGFLQIDPSQNSYNIGEGVVLTCPPNMKLNPVVERMVCLHNGWSETQLPTCLPPKVS